MNKCYWWSLYFLIDDKRYDVDGYCNHGFCYGKYQTEENEIETFEKLYQLVAHNALCCNAGKTLFRKMPYVDIPTSQDRYIRFTKDNFRLIKLVQEYREFTPTVEQAMRYLTVGQFKEYFREVSG